MHNMHAWLRAAQLFNITYIYIYYVYNDDDVDGAIIMIHEPEWKEKRNGASVDFLPFSLLRV